jgi:HlyD family secretion protein
VRTGLRNWEYVEVTNGVKEGDLVVTTVDREGVVDGARATQAAKR